MLVRTSYIPLMMETTFVQGFWERKAEVLGSLGSAGKTHVVPVLTESWREERPEISLANKT